MVTIPLGKSDWRRDISQSPYVRLRNRYFESNPTNLSEQSALLARPALQRWINVGGGPCRGGPYSQPGSFNDAIFVISGRELFRIDTDGSSTLVGNTFFNNDDTTTRASMAATAAIGTTPERLFIADGKQLKVYQPDTYARGELDATNIANNDVVEIGGVYYQFVNGSVDSGTPAGTLANPWRVAHTGNEQTDLRSLLEAIDASGIAGTTYSTALTEHPTVTALGSNADTLFVRAKALGTAGNSITTTETSSGMSWGAATLTGGLTAGLSNVSVPEGLAAISVAFIAGYVIVVPAPLEGYKGRFYWIEPGQVTINPLNFATAERSPDPIVSVRTVGDQFALFGTTSTEMWYPTGDLLAPFARSQGRIFERGLWEGTDVQIKDTLVLMDTDGAIYRIDGSGPQRISDPSIEERTRKAIKKAITQVGPAPGPGPGPLTVTIPSAAQTISSGNTFTSFPTILATASGGTGPYSYRFFWSNRSGGTFTFVGDNAQQLVTPQVTNVSNSTTATATLQCEVTDANGTTAVSNGTTYTFTNTLLVGQTPPSSLPTLTVNLTYSADFTSGINQSSSSFPNNTATPSGGVGPYTYSWYVESSAGGTPVISSPNSATTTLSILGVQSGDTASVIVRCRVTDSTGAFGISSQVFLSHSNLFDYGGILP